MADKTISITAVFKDLVSQNLAKVNSSFAQFQKKIETLNQKLAPLTGQAAQIFSAVASTAAITKALNEAEKAAQATERLRAALKENADQLKSIEAIATKLQGKTIFDDDSIKDATATFLNLGGSVADVEKNMNVIVDTATALNIPLESAARSIAQLASGSEEATRLLSKIPELKRLQELGQLDDKGIDKLIELFGGAASKFGATEFGKFKITLNQISDEFERLGNVLIGPVNAALNVLQTAFKAVNDILEPLSAKGNGLIEVIVAVGTACVVAIAGVIALGAAFTAMATAVSIAGAVMDVVLSPVFLVIAAVALLAAGILAAVATIVVFIDELSAVFTVLTPLKTAVDSVKSGFKAFFDLADAGLLDLKLGIDLLRLSFLLVKNNFLKNFVDPWTFGLREMKNALELFSELSVLSFRLLALSVAKFFEVQFRTAIQAVALLVDKITSAAAVGLEKLGVAADGLATNLAASVTDPAAVEGAYNKAIDETKQKIIDTVNARKQEALAIAQAVLEQQKLRAEEEKAFAAKIIRDAQDRKAAREKAQNDKTAKEAAEKALLVLQRESREEEARQRLQDVRLGKTKEILELEQKIAEDVLQDAYSKGLITVTDYYAQRKKLGEDAFSLEQDRVQKQLDTVTASIDKELKARQEAGADQARPVVELTNLLNKQADLEQQLIILRKTRGAVVAKLNRDEQQDTEDHIREVQAKLDTLRADALESQRNEIDALVIRQRQAVDDLNRELKKLNVSPAQAAQAVTDLKIKQQREILDAQKKQISDATENLDSVEAKYRDSIEQTTNELKLQIITEKEARDRAFEAIDTGIFQYQTYIDKLQAVKEKYPEVAVEAEAAIDKIRIKQRKLIEESENIGFSFEDGLNQGFKQFIQEAQDSFAQGKKFALDLANVLVNNLDTAINSLLDGTKDLGTAFKDFLADTLIDIGKLILKMLEMEAIAFVLASLGFGVNTGGLITAGGPKHFNRGGFSGYLPGGGPDRDSIPAMLTPGEYVTRRRAVQFYGVDLFQALNRMLVPRDLIRVAARGVAINPDRRYNVGGAVANSPSVTAIASQGRDRVLVLAPDEWERMLAGSGDTLSRHMESRRSEFRAALGI